MRKCIVCLSIALALAVFSCGKNGSGGGGEFDRDIPGTIPGVFSVGGGKRVKFSKGNLWCECKGSNEKPTIVSWHFEEHQYDFTPSIGNATGTATAERDSTHISHFMWCDSGEKAISLYYDDSWNSADTEFFAAHGFEVEGQNSWRALKAEEWEYLVNLRNCSTIGGTESARYFRGNLEGLCGLFIFPDKFEWPSGILIPANINDIDADYEYRLNLSDFSSLESQGLVFLPAAGCRIAARSYNNARILFWGIDYCTSSGCLDNGMCYTMTSMNNGVGTGLFPKYSANSVRLVMDVQSH